MATNEKDILRFRDTSLSGINSVVNAVFHLSLGFHELPLSEFEDKSAKIFARLNKLYTKWKSLATDEVITSVEIGAKSHNIQLDLKDAVTVGEVTTYHGYAGDRLYSLSRTAAQFVIANDKSLPNDEGHQIYEHSLADGRVDLSCLPLEARNKSWACIVSSARQSFGTIPVDRVTTSIRNEAAAAIARADSNADRVGFSLPQNEQVLRLVKFILDRKKENNNQSQKSIAIEFTEGDEKKANSLLRQSRRFNHLYK